MLKNILKTAFNTKLAREDTIACSEIIHFNNAGSSLMPKPVSEVLHAYLYKEERFGGYETAFLENEAIENFYVAAAKLLNCDTDEIAYVENATRAWDMAPRLAKEYGLTYQADLERMLIQQLEDLEPIRN